MHVRLITSPSELERLAKSWNRLADDVPFRRHEWLASWWAHYGPKRELFLLAVEEADGDLVGIAPWTIGNNRSRGRVVEFLGSGDVCTDYLGLLTQAGKEEDVARVVAEWLTSESSPRWDVLHLTGVDAQDVAVGRLIEHLWSFDHSVHRRAGLNCWRVELPATWEDYVAGLSKSHRKQVRRLERRVFETGRAATHVVQRKHELHRGMEILVDLHQRRRRTLNQPGCFSCSRFTGFLHAAAERLFEANLLRLHWLELDGRPAAAEFQLSGGGVTYAYQAGVDPELLDEEPGRLISIATIKYAIDNGERSLDFLRGDEPYKAHWRATPRECLDVQVVRSRAVSQVRHGIWRAGKEVKDWIRSGLTMTGLG